MLICLSRSHNIHIQDSKQQISFAYDPWLYYCWIKKAANIPSSKYNTAEKLCSPSEPKKQPEVATHLLSNHKIRQLKASIQGQYNL